MLILNCAIIVQYRTDSLFYAAAAMTDTLNLVQGAPISAFVCLHFNHAFHFKVSLRVTKFRKFQLNPELD